MSNLGQALAAFASADIASWPGLPAGVRLVDLEGLLAFDATDLRRGEAGDPPSPREWVAAETDVYAGGLRLWLDGEGVVAIEGIHPLDAAGEFEMSPQLEAPDGVFETVLGPLFLEGGEQVYAARGLAVRVNPSNGLLLGLVGFNPTELDDYRSRLRPVQEPTRPLATGGSR